MGVCFRETVPDRWRSSSLPLSWTGFSHGTPRTQFLLVLQHWHCWWKLVFLVLAAGSYKAVHGYHKSLYGWNVYWQAQLLDNGSWHSWRAFFCHKFLTSGDRKSTVRKQPSDCGNTWAVESMMIAIYSAKQWNLWWLLCVVLSSGICDECWAGIHDACYSAKQWNPWWLL